MYFRACTAKLAHGALHFRVFETQHMDLLREQRTICCLRLHLSFCAVALRAQQRHFRSVDALELLERVAVPLARLRRVKSPHLRVVEPLGERELLLCLGSQLLCLPEA